ncbi:MAG: hypothetical protein WCF03_19805, partial [Nitrososphaeraceae archaeon]
QQHHCCQGFYLSYRYAWWMPNDHIQIIKKSYKRRILQVFLVLYPEACVSLGLKHRLHSSYEKSIVVERTIEYLKDRRDI